MYYICFFANVKPIIQYATIHRNMITLSEFLEINHVIILFFYGLVFFDLGFAIIIRIRKSSRLDLARSLRWLAAFGITHGFNEWGDLFIPIQESYLSSSSIKGLYVVQLILLTVSFVCLFEFGTSLLRCLGRGVWVQGLSFSLGILWLVSTFLFFLPTIQNEQEWRNLSIALARYFIGFPGGLIAAYGLRTYAEERIASLQVSRIIRTFRVAGISLILYSVFSGLIPPPIDYFPGNILNSETFFRVVGAHPWIFRSIIGLIIAVSVIRGLDIFELETERRIEELEQYQIISTERERYARNLHDSTIQKVYTAGLLVESACRTAKPNSETGKRLDRAVGVLRDTISELRDELAELHSFSKTTMESLPVLLETIVTKSHFTSAANISLESDVPENKSLSSMRLTHVNAIVSEALANIVRHAQATEVRIMAKDKGEQLSIEIKDNGIGISSDHKMGNGLRNMRDRARLLNGTIDFINHKGTLISLVLPWNDN
jgi:signal transduction histidine kinase